MTTAIIIILVCIFLFCSTILRVERQHNGVHSNGPEPLVQRAADDIFVGLSSEIPAIGSTDPKRAYTGQQRAYMHKEQRHVLVELSRTPRRRHRDV